MKLSEGNIKKLLVERNPKEILKKKLVFDKERCGIEITFKADFFDGGSIVQTMGDVFLSP
jgi:hypothetical protein